MKHYIIFFLISLTSFIYAQIEMSATQIVEKAQEAISAIVQEAEVGKIYVGKVKRIMTFGAFVEILPGKEGLVHISKLSKKRVKRVEDVVKVGDEVVVKVANIDDQGRINLIRKE